MILTDQAPRACAGYGRDAEEEARRALAEGDREAVLSVLMRAYGAPLYRFCRQVLADPDLAQDVHQTTFVQAFESLGRFAGRSSFRAWLFAIAWHRCLDALKGARRREKRITFPGELPETPASGPEADAGVTERDRRSALRRCLETLVPRVRTALLLRFQEDLSYQEMARICRERAPTLQARVARALPVLRRCLEAQGFAP